MNPVVTNDHNRWAPDCVRHRPPRGETTQYLTDYNRGERCPACTGPTVSDHRNGNE